MSSCRLGRRGADPHAPGEYPSVAHRRHLRRGNFGARRYRPEAVSTRAYLAAATKAGADASLAKAFDTADLEAVIKPLLDGRGRARGTEARGGLER